MELCTSKKVKIYLKIEFDPQKMNSASLKLKFFLLIILTSPSLLSLESSNHLGYLENVVD